MRSIARLLQTGFGRRLRSGSLLPSSDPSIRSCGCSSLGGRGCHTGRRDLGPRATNQIDVGLKLGNPRELHFLVVCDSIHRRLQGSDQLLKAANVVACSKSGIGVWNRRHITPFSEMPRSYHRGLSVLRCSRLTGTPWVRRTESDAKHRWIVVIMGNAAWRTPCRSPSSGTAQRPVRLPRF